MILSDKAMLDLDKDVLASREIAKSSHLISDTEAYRIGVRALMNANMERIRVGVDPLDVLRYKAKA